ncbi:MAG: aspartate/glutamate racemase family protein [Parvibaculaceae bacterium]
MRLLLINANTSAEITRRVAEEARKTAGADTEIQAVTASFGSSLIRTRADNVIAAHGALTALARSSAGYDAAVLAVSTDTGLAALREISPVPVVGMTEAALLTACMVGSRIGLVVFDKRAMPVFRETVAMHGLSDRLAGIRTVTMTVADFRRPERVREQVLGGIESLVEQDGVECVIVTGATMAGVARSLQAEAPVPLLDGISCAVVQAEGLVRLRIPKPRVGSLVRQRSEDLTGVDPALAELLRS